MALSTASKVGPGAARSSDAATTAEGEQQLIVRQAPHIHSGQTTSRVMLAVVVSLVPAVVASLILFRWAAAQVLLGAILGSLAGEAAALRLRGKPVSLRDGSALVTGLLLALTLPPGSPLWMSVLGGLVAIVLGKQLFGGLGANPFNPALVGRVFLLISFPDLMTRWIAPFDAATSATPLSVAGSFSGQGWSLFLGTHAGSLGETSALALLLGGGYLLARRIIDWRIPVSILGSSALMALLFGADPLFHLLAGGLLIGAFFMATDWVTSPVTRSGRVCFGIGIGLLTMVIRLWGNYPEGVSFVILFMNAVTPLLNLLTRPRPQLKSVRQETGVRRVAGGPQRIMVTMGVVAAVSGAVLAVFFGMMNPRVEMQRQLEMEDAFRDIYPQAASFEPVDLSGKLPKRVDSPVYRVLDASANEIGIAYVARPAGFQGDITLAVGVSPREKKIVAVRVLAHTETAGLGSRVAEASFLDQFAGKPVTDAFSLSKDVDGISGATVSSGAVAEGLRESAGAVLDALENGTREVQMDAGAETAFRAIFPKAVSLEPVDLGGKLPKRVDSPVYRVLDAGANEIGIAYVARPAGFKGDITLAVGVSAQEKKIVAVRVLAHTETAGLGSKVAETSFLDQFAGKPVTDAFSLSKDVDGISGATVSSGAVAEGLRDSAGAVLDALASGGKAAQMDAVAETAFRAVFPQAASFEPVDLDGGLPEQVDNPVYRVRDRKAAQLGVAYVARPQGFKGEITLAVGLDPASGRLVGVEVIAQSETAGLGSKVTDPSYLEQYAGKSVTDGFVIGEDVDGISGATVSSRAVASGLRESARGVLAALARVAP